ncbi:DUF4159 domain-containing protein [Singulisphaera acidiphila]|uniref:DUF4159 domain-containing protein n=1 Tax=Singulisphaera acidiphila (strain ATCC BAA-1392 / DSM 18658 / VKM B-2454 / MOB10) TaxID=886293 RepID=L0D7K7_SINAD|nr:DUF4159 domain-containing protein [Singulisphaera acidiphila]AGA24845.1 hypothetical protein Sinac_0406 [Singulisphaera acidiphila DSM 18658]
MTRRRLILVALPCLLAIVTGVCLGQPRFGRGPRTRPGIIPDDRAGVPDWKVDERFKNDVFTFVRVEYDTNYGGGFGGRRGWGRGRGGSWMTDWPDSDLNFSFRLQQLTALKVNPEPISLRLTDERLFDYPFLYMIEPGFLYFSEEEVVALRRYLLNGGFLMVDDFWGDSAWERVAEQFKRVFPDREPTEISIDHEIFHCVYRLKEKPQVPSIHSWQGPGSTVTWEEHNDGDSRTVHYKQLIDDKGRMMAIFCHNTDLGDGWEREGMDSGYFHEFSEKKSYPMGINIVTYAMTH